MKSIAAKLFFAGGSPGSWIVSGGLVAVSGFVDHVVQALYRQISDVY